MLFFAPHLYLCLYTVLLTAVEATLQIVPGATWTAKGSNAHIQAHGGSITKVGDTYYLSWYFFMD